MSGPNPPGLYRQLFHYCCKHLIQSILLWLALASLVFFLIRTIPGHPANAILGDNTHSPDISRFQQNNQLSHPLLSQYFQFLYQLLHLNPGHSLFTQEPVLQSILSVLPYTLTLSSLALLFCLLLSLPLGILAAFKPRILTLTTISTTLGTALPTLVLGPLLILLLSFYFPVFPITGHHGFKSLILPALTLAIPMSSLLTRIIHTAVASELQKPYVLLARAKGLSQKEIFRHHLLKNALFPILTTLGLQLGALLSGTVITETVFSRPGIGNLLVQAIQQRDYPLIQGLVLFITLTYLCLNFLVDTSYYLLDPRLRQPLTPPPPSRP